MARNTVTKDTSAAASSADGDIGDLFSDWLATQSELVGTSMAQFANVQSNVIEAWLQLQSEWTRQWQEQTAQAMQMAFKGGGDGQPSSSLPTNPFAVFEAMWQPWATWRGGEQLG
jgi:hypothetical protein